MLPAATVTGISSNDVMTDGGQRRHQIGSSGYLLQAQPSNVTRNLAPSHVDAPSTS
ncbi:hypothetical protein EGR_10751 [Echinococcus granulosus]|uniref:Uncharacterized protein n=1 Tax=Echinococcus granulosus TaxID=6210 RepID=W6ULI9_ECHGR|nr:hypothetical protein EGR_10751 [Echinococcus granulosus]EUB54394.1 hypothetical protein EGR_10751 [Echinococcus granulosus]